MARANQDLLARIAKTLRITPKAVYPKIQRVIAETGLELDLAALELARRNKINITRYSTRGQREQLRNVRGANDHAPSSPRVEMPSPLKRPLAKAAKRGLAKPAGRTIFVVHGRDSKLTASILSFLYVLKLEPVEWSQALSAATKGGDANPYIGRILDKQMEQAGAFVVLFSPDDKVHLNAHLCAPGEKSTEGKPQDQARANVIFEAGLFMGSHPKKTLLVQVGKVKLPSDLDGKHMMRLNDTPTSRKEFADRLNDIVGNVVTTGSLWLSTGTFKPAETKRRKAGKSRRTI